MHLTCVLCREFGAGSWCALACDASAARPRTSRYTLRQIRTLFGETSGVTIRTQYRRQSFKFCLPWHLHFSQPRDTLISCTWMCLCRRAGAGFWAGDTPSTRAGDEATATFLLYNSMRFYALSRRTHRWSGVIAQVGYNGFGVVAGVLVAMLRQCDYRVSFVHRSVNIQVQRSNCPHRDD